MMMVLWGGWMLFAGDPLTQASQDARFYNQRVQDVIRSIDHRLERLPKTSEWYSMEPEEQAQSVKLQRSAMESLEIVRLSTLEIADRTRAMHQGLSLLHGGIGIAWIALGLMVLVEMPGAMAWISRLALATLGVVIGGSLLVQGWGLRTIGARLALQIDTVWAAADPTHAPSASWQGMLAGRWTALNIAQSIWPMLAWAGLLFFIGRPRPDDTQAGPGETDLSEYGLRNE